MMVLNGEGNATWKELLFNLLLMTMIEVYMLQRPISICCSQSDAIVQNVNIPAAICKHQVRWYRRIRVV